MINRLCWAEYATHSFIATTDATSWEALRSACFFLWSKVVEVALSDREGDNPGIDICFFCDSGRVSFTIQANHLRPTHDRTWIVQLKIPWIEAHCNSLSWGASAPIGSEEERESGRLVNEFCIEFARAVLAAANDERLRGIVAKENVASEVVVTGAGHTQPPAYFQILLLELIHGKIPDLGFAS